MEGRSRSHGRKATLNPGANLLFYPVNPVHPVQIQVFDGTGLCKVPKNRLCAKKRKV
jgi:hypothetical protein